MADEEKKENEEGEEGEESSDSPGKKKGILLGGGVVGLVVVAWAASLMAVPAEPEERAFSGPFVAPLSEEKIQVNLAGEGGRRYLVMSLSAVYDAYDETYFATRVIDPLYLPLLQDALIDIGSQKAREEVTSQADRDVFKQEIRTAVDPILFPIHLGDSLTPYDPDTLSGLAPGESVYTSTLRGPQAEHSITVDNVAKSLQLDGGDEIRYAGIETDLELISPTGKVVFVDVTGLEEGFQGEVPVGVLGRVRRVIFSELLVQ